MSSAVPQILSPSCQQGRESVLFRLKEETRCEHERLERDLNLLREDLTLNAYGDLLERFYGFYAPWEQTIFATLPENWAAFYEGRRKLPGLTSDLKFLGRATCLLPLCAGLPDLSTGARILGSLYVIEGSTLGGQLIARHMRRLFGFTGGQGCAFFEGYGAQTGVMWRQFRSFLLQFSPKDEDSAVVQGAKDTFAGIHRWLCRIEE